MSAPVLDTETRLKFLIGHYNGLTSETLINNVKNNFTNYVTRKGISGATISVKNPDLNLGDNLFRLQGIVRECNSFSEFKDAIEKLS